jgi:aspartate racemase
MSAPRRIVGVIGGMGPAATIDFMAKVLAFSQAARGPGSREQEDVRLLVDSNPAVPDRNAAIAGIGPSPGPYLAAMAQGLERAGADFLVMPCNAAHAFVDDILRATALPFVHIVDEVAGAVRQRFPGIRRVGVLAAAGAADARLYEHALAPYAIEAVTPEGEERRRFMNSVWAVKAGDLGEGTQQAMADSARMLLDRGAEMIVAGCTEVPLVLSASNVPAPFLDATALLAERTVAYARGTHIPGT